MKQKELNAAELMVLEDISSHPGTTILGIAKRCAKTYRKSYISICVMRLKALDYVEDRSTTRNTAALHVKEEKDAIPIK